jgi:SPP1 family predicted phage head-tail adaptor
MFFSDKITLRTETVTLDDYGDPVKTYTSVEVWANAKSVKRSEFYAADSNGRELSITFEVHAEDYDGQKNILYNGKEYDVVRDYQIGLGIVELNCSDKRVV